jgi:hypothetical protein
MVEKPFIVGAGVEWSGVGPLAGALLPLSTPLIYEWMSNVPLDNPPIALYPIFSLNNKQEQTTVIVFS